jgi:hypothetical protein
MCGHEGVEHGKKCSGCGCLVMKSAEEQEIEDLEKDDETEETSNEVWRK